MCVETDESTLIQAAQCGELDAFNILVDRYQAMLFRIALRMLGDDDSAADAAQAAWIAAYRKIREFRGGRFKTWLARVVVNTCYDEIRLRRRRREVPLLPSNVEGDEVDSPFWLADRAAGVEEQVDVRQFNEMIGNCLQSLAPHYRAVLVLVDIEGLSYEEASAAMHIPLGTVRSRLARARMSLRDRLRSTSGLLPDQPHSRRRASACRQVSARCS